MVSLISMRNAKMATWITMMGAQMCACLNVDGNVRSRESLVFERPVEITRKGFMSNAMMGII